MTDHDLGTMTVRLWRSTVRPVRNEVLSALVDGTGCGPFDGGCVVFAEALVEVVGGEVVVLERADGTADHAAVSAGGRLWDMDGPLDPKKFVDRFNRAEFGTSTGFRPILPGDLPDAPRNADVSAELRGMLASVLGTTAPHPAEPGF